MPDGKPLVIVTFGDSTTAPRGTIRIFTTRLEEQFAGNRRPVHVINAGVPGNDTRQARERLDREVIARNPDVVTISFGINDSAVDVFKGTTRPRVPLQEYEENLAWIVERLRGCGIDPILMTPNPVAWTDELKRLYAGPPYRLDDPDGWNVLLRDYAEAVRRVAATHHVPLVDAYALFQAYAAQPGHDLNGLMVDGMHPGDSGHAIITEHLMELLRTKSALSQATSQPVR